MNKLTRANAHLRQVCASGMPVEVLTGAISEAIEPIVGNSCVFFLRADSNGGTKDIWLSRPAPINLLNNYIKEYADRPKQAVFGGQKLALRRYSGVRALPDWKAFYKHDYYQAIWRPLGMECALSMFLREPGRLMALGNCIVYRSKGERKFSNKDVLLLENLIPHITHAFASQNDLEQTNEWISTNERGLIIERNDKYISSDLVTEHLLYQLSNAFGQQSNYFDVQTILLRVVERFKCIFAGKQASPPSAFFINRYGRFVLRAHWLHGDNERLVGITIDKEIPIDLHMLQRLGDLALSPTQRQVCFLAAKNSSHTQIAASLEITPNTAQDHLKKIYTALNISDRHSLTALLRRPRDIILSTNSSTFS